MGIFQKRRGEAEIRDLFRRLVTNPEFPGWERYSLADKLLDEYNALKQRELIERGLDGVDIPEVR